MSTTKSTTVCSFCNFQQLKLLFAEERVKRYSSFLGFTHLLRFFTRLPDIVQKIPTENETSLKYLADGAADFCKYLSGSIDKYYNDAYYGA